MLTQQMQTAALPCKQTEYLGSLTRVVASSNMKLIPDLVGGGGLMVWLT